MAGVNLLVWTVARAGGFTAYGLLTLSVVLGLALGLQWRSPRWPRFATTELHRFVTLLTLVFLALHVLAITVDPFMRFRLVEILVPFASHYRPLWMGLGVVAAWLALAVWLSTRLQRLIGYRAWRRLHYATIAVYLLATIHGFATGTDTHTAWAPLLYGTSLLAVGALLVVRVLGAGPTPARPDAGRAPAGSGGGRTLRPIPAGSQPDPRLERHSR